MYTNVYKWIRLNVCYKASVRKFMQMYTNELSLSHWFKYNLLSTSYFLQLFCFSTIFAVFSTPLICILTSSVIIIYNNIIVY